MLIVSMIFTIDCHVHLYPQFDLHSALFNGLQRLRSFGGDRFGMILVERRDCDAYTALRNGVLENVGLTTFPTHIELAFTPELKLLVFPGRQINSVERIEILSLLTDVRSVDGLPAEDVLTKIIEANGVPVINWAPGKWLGKRGQIIQSLCNLFGGKIALGDTTLRAVGISQPALMLAGAQAVIAGSDSLPIRGDENLIGSYVTKIEAPNESELQSTLLQIRNTERHGKRSSLVNLVVRLGHYYATKR